MDQAHELADLPPGAYEWRGPDAAVWTAVWLETSKFGPLSVNLVQDGGEVCYEIRTSRHFLRVFPEESYRADRVTSTLIKSALPEGNSSE